MFISLCVFSRAKQRFPQFDTGLFKHEIVRFSSYDHQALQLLNRERTKRP